MKTTILFKADDSKDSPEIQKIENPPARPTFRTRYGLRTENHGRDDLEAFEEHGRNLRHYAETNGDLENS